MLCISKRPHASRLGAEERRQEEGSLEPEAELHPQRLHLQPQRARRGPCRPACAWLSQVALPWGLGCPCRCPREAARGTSELNCPCPAGAQGKRLPPPSAPSAPLSPQCSCLEGSPPLAACPDPSDAPFPQEPLGPQGEAGSTARHHPTQVCPRPALVGWPGSRCPGLGRHPP